MTPLQMLRAQMAEAGFSDLLHEGDTGCPVRACRAFVRSTQLGPKCGEGHDLGEMLGALIDEAVASVDEDIARSDEALGCIDATKHFDQAQRYRAILAESIDKGSPLEDMDIENAEAKLAPRWPSGLRDLITYGNTIVMADAGIGKSILSISTAVAAAISGGWQVIVFNAELSLGELKERINRYYAGLPEPPTPKQRARIRWLAAGMQTTIPGMVQRCQEHVRPGKKLLVIIDSINSLAEFVADDKPGSDLTETRRLYHWATQVRRATEGEIAFLIVSETNASGGVKGRKGEFSADVVVKLSRVEEDLVDINVIKSRSDRAGPLGEYVRDWRYGRFVR